MTTPTRKSPLPFARFAVALTLGLAAGYALWGGTAGPGGAHESADAPHRETAPEVEVWTCSMHPQFRLPKPGACPICGMDLIPLTAGSEGGGLRRLTVPSTQIERMRVRTVPVQKRFPEAELRLVGKVTYDETRLAYITAWVPGRIDDLYVDFTGVTVRKGDHMVQLYSPELYATQQELLQARMGFEELGNSELQSFRASARGTLDSAREKLRLLGLKPEQIAEVEERGEAREHVTIYSPASGLVIERMAQEGMYVETGTRIFTIADLTNVWVQLDAYESDLEWLRYGQEVHFETEAYKGRAFTGRISFINPVLDRRSRTVKVRVNVPNEDGLLKPEMFVRATVKVRVAAGGQAMDPELVGKWISPMHPEIVKDGPGACDVCGMDLVPAEELGYVPAHEVASAAPLLVPVSAALLTGKRAVVYVEVPDTDEPTFEGREVVLGPRVGDEYIVRHGLEEGELVVAEGNFKIDSALQIQAKPSMMSAADGPADRPTGGAPAGGHDHGESGAPKTVGKAPSAHEPSEAARARLQVLERLYAAVARAMEGGTPADARGAFAALGDAVDATDMALFVDELHAEWMELAMVLSNDAFLGASARTPDELVAARESLDRTVGRLRLRLGSRPASPPAPAPRLTPSVRAELDALQERYGGLHAALSADEFEATRDAARSLQAAAAELEADELPEDGRAAWARASATLREAANEILAAADIAEARAGFERVATSLEDVLRALGTGTPVHVMHCPMAFDGRGARWLQTSEELSNPYFGAAMLRCGSLVEVLDPREASHDE